MDASRIAAICHLAIAANNHPLAHPMLPTLWRMLRWQVACRANPQGLIVQYVDDTRLLVAKGMVGATGNVYFGLHEYESMAFVLHLLRKDDVFLDVGANVGTYTVLASGVRQARTIAFEPVPATHAHLVDNVVLNRLLDLVDMHMAAVASEPGITKFTNGLDSMNHISVDGDPEATIEVGVETIDEALGDYAAVAMKLDVEGYELAALRGARRCLASPSLLAVAAETNGLVGRFGASVSAVVSLLAENGFRPFSYEPKSRSLKVLEAPRAEGNTLFLRNIAEIRDRIASAVPFRVVGVAL